MPARPNQYVWEWLDEKGNPVYLGNMPAKNGEHPADILWDRRRTLNSPLGKWLQSLPEQPPRSQELVSVIMYRSEANALAAMERKRLKKLNVQLLSNRPFGTKIGGGYARAVISPQGDLYESVRAAAAEEGVDAATITRRCKDPANLWSYIE
jgi:hypothetical protein